MFSDSCIRLIPITLVSLYASDSVMNIKAIPYPVEPENHSV